MFKKSLYSKYSDGHVEGNLHKPQKRIRQKAKNFRSDAKKDKKSWIFHFFTQIFLRRSSAQFWQLNRKEIARRPEIFRSSSQNDQNKLRFSNSCFSSNCSSRSVDYSFDKPAEKNGKQPKLSLHVRKRFNKFVKIFSPKCPYWHVKCRFHNVVGKFSTEGLVTKHFQRTLGIQISQSRRKNFDRRSSAHKNNLMKRDLVLGKKLLKMLLRTRKMKFRPNLVKELCQTAQQFSHKV